MDKDTIQAYFIKAAVALNLKADGCWVYGWNNKSAGSKVIDRIGNFKWLRVIVWPNQQKNERVWFGLKSAGQITGVNKPAWLGDYEWEDGEFRCRADVLEFIGDKPVSDLPNLRQEIDLSGKWLEKLRGSLESLRKVPTDRIAVRQDLVTRRLHERYGQDVDAEIKEWETSHGDLHWANLTMPGCWLLDWEAWGTAPKGFDIALLYCFTLSQPKTAKAIFNHFKDCLDTQDGHKARMFACAELMRMTELYSDHADLYPYLVREAEQLARSCSLRISKPQ
jgi:hypothetical protein